jgi:hypothetical protein
MRLVMAAVVLHFLSQPADAASAVLHGVRLSCKAARAIYVLPTLPRYYAQADMRRRIIYLGRRELAGMTRAELVYVMAHECGHLKYGRDEHVVDGHAEGVVKPSARLCRITGRCKG